MLSQHPLGATKSLHSCLCAKYITPIALCRAKMVASSNSLEISKAIQQEQKYMQQNKALSLECMLLFTLILTVERRHMKEWCCILEVCFQWVQPLYIMFLARHRVVFNQEQCSPWSSVQPGVAFTKYLPVDYTCSLFSLGSYFPF